MRFTIAKHELANALKAAMACAERKNTMPVLSHLLIDTDSPKAGTISIVASDLDRQVKLTVPASISAGGTAALLGGMLLDIATNASGDEIAFQPGNDGRIKVSSGRSHYQVPMLPAADFPLMSVQKADNFELPDCSVIRAMSDVSFAAETLDIRPHLCGVYLHPRDGVWTAVATDGKKLARRDVPEPEAGAKLPAAIMPPKTVSLASKLFNGGPLAIDCSEKLWTFRNDRISLTTKLIDGAFPGYGHLIKENPRYLVSAGKNALLGSIARASIAVDGASNLIRMEFGDNVLRIFASHATGGAESFDEIDVDGPAVPFVIIANAAFVTGTLGMMTGDTITLGIDGEGQPVKVTDGRPDAVCLFSPWGK